MLVKNTIYDRDGNYIGENEIEIFVPAPIHDPEPTDTEVLNVLLGVSE